MIRYWEEDTDTEIGRPFDLEKHDKEMSNKWLDKVKKAREKIENINPVYSTGDVRTCVLKNCDDIKTEVLSILDKMLESED